MKKRRVLALLLTLSLSVSMNGMTALAAGPVIPGITVMTEGDSVSAAEEIPDDGSDSEGTAGDTSGGEDNSEKPKEPENPDDSEKPVEPGNPDDSEKPVEPGNPDNPNKPVDPENPDDPNKPVDPENPDDSNKPVDPENPDDPNKPVEPENPDDPNKPVDPENPDDPNKPVDPENPDDLIDPDNPDASVPVDPENPDELLPEEEDGILDTGEIDPDKEEDAEPEEVESSEDAGIQLMSFTDDVGMKITYDARAVEEYQLTVSGGVLNSVKNGDGSAVSGVVVIPEDQNITAIGAAFQGNEEITYVKLPKGVTTIQAGAFKNCNKLQGVYLPASVESIGDNAFEQCRNLVKIAIPKRVSSIGSKAFYQNSKLFMVYMKDADYSSLESIGADAFYECTSLAEFCSDTAFVIPGRLKSIGARAFYKCKSITALDFNENIETLGESVFAECTSLKSVVLSSRLQDIPKAAFMGCDNLTRVEFKSGNTDEGIPGNQTIGESAFQGCIRLGGVELSYSVARIDNYAFSNCTKLVSVQIPNGSVTIGDSVFPNVSTLTLIGIDGSNVERYTKDKAIKFAGYMSYQSDKYLYSVLATGNGSGTITVKDKDGKDPNTLNKKQGVPYNTKLYVYYSPAKGSSLVSGSVKCNGVALPKDSNGKYYFNMPIGGALITAEFVNTSSSKQTPGLAENVIVEISNGEVTTEKNAATGRNEVKAVSLKIGQYSRMFLIDERDDNKTIDSAKIKYTTDNKAVATVASNGMIHAVKAGSAKIKAVVTGGDGAAITKEIRVNVKSSDVVELKVKASDYNASVIKLTTSAKDDVQTATVDKTAVKKALTFKIKANAYDVDEDDMAVALKWSTSDTRVAKISSTSTSASSPVNTVTIPANTDGEATITVTATNSNKKTVTQKFIVSVKDYTPRLVSNSLTINPKQTGGAILEIVNAYDKEADRDSVALMYSDNSAVSNDFKLELLGNDGTDEEKEAEKTQYWDKGIARYRITALPGVGSKTYSVRVNINHGTFSIPLKITVKSSQPNPKVAFAKKQKKLNLFNAKDTTPVQMTVSSLGSAKVSEYTLEPLSNSDDDKLFVENFKVEKVDGSHCTITQKSEKLLYTSKKKPAVTGYLVIKYEGYGDSVNKKFKITIPTETVTPSYKLNKTSDTYYRDCDAQSIELQLLDKKNKNQKINLNEGGYHVRVTTGSGFTRSVTTCEVTDTGNIRLPVSKNPEAGKVYLELTNDSWTEGKKFTYTYNLKTTGATPKISLSKTTVTLNPSYPEQEVTFGLKSNLKDTVVADDQEFVIPKVNSKTQLQYDKLDVSYENGVGTVSINDPTIANGTYSFVCNSTEYEFKNGRRRANKVTLKVKVARSVPQVKAKGSIAFNTQATKEEADGSEEYVEKAELTFTTKNLPKGYVLDKQATLDTIKCTTKNCSDYVDSFNWDLDTQTNKLKVSMNDWCSPKTYKFSITPVFTYQDASSGDGSSGDGSSTGQTKSANTVRAKSIGFNVKVYSGTISVGLSAKGKLNLLDRSGQYTTKNSIVYTPTFKNLKDTVDDAKIYDASGKVPSFDDEQSEFFEVKVSAGKLYVAPKKGVKLNNNKTYKVMIWVHLKDYQFGDSDGGGKWYNKVLSVKTGQTIPKATTNKSTVNLYLSNKNYEATFIVKKKDTKAIGKVESITFGEKDTNALHSFVTTTDPATGKNIAIESEPLADGSLKVTLKLKDTVSYKCNTTNKIKMYVRYEGQGTNTTGTAITMNVKINK